MLLVKAQQISVRLGHQEVLTQVDLSIKPQEIVTVVGPNGAGKSTLLKVILGLIRPHTGSVSRKAQIRMGYMPQHPRIDPFIPLTVMRFLALARVFDAAWKAQMIAELNISHLLARPLQNISGGEMQRVILARALFSKPELLVLDEPVQGVDLSGQTELYRLIARIRDQYGCGILMVSHDLHLVMAETDCVVCLNQHVCCAGTPAKVRQSPEFLKLFGLETSASFAVYAHHHDHSHFGKEKCP